MSSLLLNIGNLIGVTATAGTGGSSGTSGAGGTSATAGASTVATAGTSGTSGSTGASTASAPQAASSGVPVATTALKAGWGMQAGQTVYINTRSGVGGFTAWVPYIVAYVFSDGNAVLIQEPDCVVYTGALAVGANLRRVGETYSDPYPGP